MTTSTVVTSGIPGMGGGETGVGVGTRKEVRIGDKIGDRSGDQTGTWTGTREDRREDISLAVPSDQKV